MWRYWGVWTFCRSWGRDMINLERKKRVPKGDCSREWGKEREVMVKACDGLGTTHTTPGVRGRKKMERKGGGRHTGHLVYI